MDRLSTWMATRPERTEAEREARAEWWIRTLRSLALFAAGLGLTIREGVTTGPERPSLYIVYVGMMGFGPVISYAESRAKEKGK